jgi:hypothetical protein
MNTYHVVTKKNEDGKIFDGTVQAVDPMDLLFFHMPSGFNPGLVTTIELVTNAQQQETKSPFLDEKGKPRNWFADFAG